MSGALYLAAADAARAWLVVATPSRETLFAWDHARAKGLRVEERVRVAVQIGAPEAGDSRAAAAVDGDLFIDARDRLVLRVAAPHSPTGIALTSIDVDAALVGAIALTYPHDKVVIRSSRTWSVLYRSRAAA
jgi:hypothetical protein